MHRRSAMTPLARLRAAGFTPRQIASKQTGFVYQLHNVISRVHAQEVFEALRASTDSWLSAKIITDSQGRQACYFGDPDAIFSYVGLSLEPRPWPRCLDDARKAVGRIADAHSTRLTACLANLYERGTGEIPWHHDEVRACGEAKLVIALSLGGERRMLLRRRDCVSTPTVSLSLPAGSAVVMGGSAQDHWEHALPLDGEDAPPRISLTFRSIEPGYEVGRPPPLPNE